jgi:hypothetical protein
MVFKRRFKKALRLDVSPQDIGDVGLHGFREKRAVHRLRAKMGLSSWGSRSPTDPSGNGPVGPLL